MAYQRIRRESSIETCNGGSGIVNHQRAKLAAA